MDKSNPNRFSLQFNNKSSTESFAIRVLNDQPPRKRSRYVADAITFFEQRHDSDYINALAEALALRMGPEMQNKFVFNENEYEVGKKRRGRPPKTPQIEQSISDGSNNVIFAKSAEDNKQPSPGKEKKGGLALSDTDPMTDDRAETPQILDDDMLAGMNALLGQR